MKDSRKERAPSGLMYCDMLRNVTALVTIYPAALRTNLIIVCQESPPSFQTVGCLQYFRTPLAFPPFPS